MTATVKVGTRIPKHQHSVLTRIAENAKSTVGAVVARGIILVIDECRGNPKVALPPDGRNERWRKQRRKTA